MVGYTIDRAEPQLPQFYAGREVLITGATGFMGKVLIERLLSTCPEVRRLHLLVRDKRGQAPDKRLVHLKQSQVFDNIRARSPSQLDKLVAVAGDITEPRLGLDDNAMTGLREVSVVFHNAASVRFADPLPNAISQNVLSALYVMDVCDKLPELQVLLHVSTAFSNSELPHIEERVYDMAADLPDVLRLLDDLPPHLVKDMTPKLIHPKPNTYLFTKALAEDAVARRTPRNYSVTIFRPSIVVSAHRAPSPGWVEGMAGATGTVLAFGRGVLRAFLIDLSGKSDLVPVDIAIDNMLAVAWDTAVERPTEAVVYYCGSQENPLLWGVFQSTLHHSAVHYPFDDVLYYPHVFGMRYKWLHKACEVLLQTVPLYAAELVTKMCGVKKHFSFITAAQRLSEMSEVLGDITCNQWTFSCDRMRLLRKKLYPTDGHIYHLDIREVNWQEHITNFHCGVRKFMLKQKEDTLPDARRRLHRLRSLHYVVRAITALLCFKIVRYILKWIL